MNFSGLLCKLFGHQPHEYSYTSGYNTETTYTECARCCKRKSVGGYGWLTPEEDNDA